MESSKIMMFPEMGNSGIDPNLLLALNNNGGFGGNNWMWILFLWLIWVGEVMATGVETEATASCLTRLQMIVVASS